MAKLQLKEMLAAMPMSEFSFLTFEKQVSSPDTHSGEKITYLVFQLENPIEKVIGSTLIPDPSGEGNDVHPIELDVMEVRCNLELMLKDNERPEGEEEFYWETDKEGKLTKKGSYSGDLILDVSKKGEVWLTDMKFRAFGRQQFKVKDGERYQKYYKRR